ncbi:hypothetical protein TI03_00455 [Achromatium sp. WMS1]|nr:hypothetical protein TI03_00455 [Achromatium sp. WMS1]
MLYVPSREASKRLGLHPNTLRKYVDEAKIKHIKTGSVQRRYTRIFFVRALRAMKFTEALPDDLRDDHVIKNGNKWYVALPVSKKRNLAGNQDRLCALALIQVCVHSRHFLVTIIAVI